jgi:hypothetical protein
VVHSSIPLPRRLRQEDHEFEAYSLYSEFKGSLGNIERPCLKIKIKKKGWEPDTRDSHL